jgi:hypothetical protein
MARHSSPATWGRACWYVSNDEHSARTPDICHSLNLGCESQVESGKICLERWARRETLTARSENHYVPILKGRLGEFNALRSVTEEQAGKFTPLIEFVPQGNELDDDGEPDHAAVATTVNRTIDRLEKAWPKSTDVFVDLHALPAIVGYYPVPNVIDYFYRLDQSQVIPVCRPQDLEEPGLLERLHESLDVFADRNICIRLSDEDLDERDEPIATSVEQLLGKLGTVPDDVDLVVDFSAINETSASFAARIGRLVISDLPYLDSWKSLTVAAGGFPSSLDDVAPDSLTEKPRWELTTFGNLRDRLLGRSRVPSFGDYAVAYPRQTAGVPFAPAPQIRYTASDGWLILKGRKNNRRGHAQFLDICQTITQHDEFTADFSWGDRQIALNAQYAHMEPVPEGAKPGNATTWRAIGTSHHLALVINRLTTVGVP